MSQYLASTSASEMEQVIAKLRAEKAELEAKNAALAAKAAAKIRPVSFKVSEKGAVSVYGLGRFPVTLYRSQWERLIGDMAKLQDFIAANAERLTTRE